MTISPRNNETAAVQAILESDDYESPKAMARAIVVAVTNQLALRSSLAVGLMGKGEGGAVYPVGPIWDRKAAERLAQGATDCGWRAKILALGAPSRTVPIADHVPTSLQKCECGHWGAIHSGTWGCCAYLAKKQKCECKTLTLKSDSKERWLVP